MNKNIHQYISKIWKEIPHQNNPSQSQSAFVQGYDLIREILPKANISDYISVLYRGEKFNSDQARLFHYLQLFLANLGPRNLGVRAAMNSGVGGNSAASALISAIAVLSGQRGGSEEILNLMKMLETSKADFHLIFKELELWNNKFKNSENDHIFGFETQFETTTLLYIDFFSQTLTRPKA